VRDLPENVTVEQIRELFEPDLGHRYGEVTKIILLEQKLGPAKRVFGFVHFADHSSAMKAIEKVEKYAFWNRELSIFLAKHFE